MFVWKLTSVYRTPISCSWEENNLHNAYIPEADFLGKKYANV